MTRLLLIALVLLITGCTPRAQQLAVAGVEDAMRTNNATVAALTALQEKARFVRKAALMAAAKMAGSYADGKEQLDAIDASYVPVFEAFHEAERVSEALAVGLEIARADVKRGDIPNMVDLFTLAMVLQGSYSKLATKLSEAL